MKEGIHPEYNKLKAQCACGNEIEMGSVDKEIKTDFTLADRSNMKYSVLIGQNILKQGFLIDPSKEAEGFYSEDD